MNKVAHKLIDATIIMTLVGGYFYALGMAYYHGYWQYFGIPTTSVPYPDFKEILVTGVVSMVDPILILIFVILTIICSIILHRWESRQKIGDSHNKIRVYIIATLLTLFFVYSIYYTDKKSIQRAKNFSKNPRIAHLTFRNKTYEGSDIKEKLSLLFFNDEQYIFFTPHAKGLDNMPKIIIINKDEIARIELE